MAASNKAFYGIMAFFAVVFFCFPSQNMSPDALTYAADVRYGNDLFLPHHLLYNAMHWCFYKLALCFNTDVSVVWVMQKATALISLCTLWATYRVLQLLSSRQVSLALTVFVACCFGFLRYTAECEVYVTPILFSMVSTYGFVRYMQAKQMGWVVLAGLSASLAVLFHQIHLFWGLGLFVGLWMSKNYKALAVYASCTISVLLVYAWVWVGYCHQTFSPEGLFRYLASYYYASGADQSGIGLKILMLAPISLVRTFMQVHGDLLIQTSLQPALYVLFVCPLLLLCLLVAFVRKTHYSPQANRMFVFTFALIAFLQLAFAVYSDGNMEFMVMLPFALVLLIAVGLQPSVKQLWAVSVVLFVWNFAFAMYPNARYNQYGVEQVVDYVHAHPNEPMLACDAAMIGAYNYLEYGEYDLDRVMYGQQAIKDSVYITDLLDRPRPFNRQVLLQQNTLALECLDTVAQVEADYGSYHLYRVRVK